MRWGHEPNGNWYAWAAANPAGQTPDQYIAAWRYLVGRERKLPGKSNIRWFWCPNATDVRSIEGVAYPMEQYWPGDEWVDLVGCDGFNEPTAWTTFDDIFRRPYARISALSKKPFWIGETGCHEPLPGQQEDKGTWIVNMLRSRAFPNLQVVCYFDYNASARQRADLAL